MKLKALICLALLATLQPVWASDECEITLARQFMDQLTNRNLVAANRSLQTWQSREYNPAAHTFYKAVLAATKAGVKRKNSEPDYSQSLKLLNQVITTLQEGNQAAAKVDDQNAFVLASANALSARLLLEQKHYFNAWSRGRSAKQQLIELVEQNPEFADAYVMLGLFEYYTGSIPRGLGWLARLIQFSGDRQTGIQLMHQAVAKASVGAPEAARILLTEFSFSPQQRCCYQALATTMAQRYPRNIRFMRVRNNLNSYCAEESDNKHMQCPATLAEARCKPLTSD